MATKVNNPYSLAALMKNLVTSATIHEKMGMNMYRFTNRYVPSYNTITSIPSEYSPTNVDSSLATEWREAFCYSVNLTTLPTPFYNMASAVNCANMFGGSNACNKITNFAMVKFGDKVNILDNAFHNCTRLVQAPTLPNRVRSVKNMFKNCTNLVTAPYIPQSIDNICNMAGIFNGCTSLKGDIYLGCCSMDQDNRYYNTFVQELANCSPGSYKHIYVPYSKYYDTQYCKTMWKIYYALGNTRFNSQLKINVYSNRDTVFDAQYLFARINAGSTVPAGYLPADINSKMRNCVTAANMFRLSSVTTLPNPFYDLSNLENVCYMFAYRNGITDASMVNFAGRLTSLRSTFYQCKDLVKAPVIPEGITDLSSTFYNCVSLVNSPAIPSSVRDMSLTFESCTSLKNVGTISPGVVDMSRTFRECISLTDIPEIPNTVTDLSETFYNCRGLVSLGKALPASAVTMNGTFRLCTSLKAPPVIPNSVTDLSYCFSGCYNLTSAPVIPNGVRSLRYTFANCGSLVNAPVIPNSVTSMAGTFSQCSKINWKTVVIPPSVTSMQNFYQNTSITSCPHSFPANLTYMGGMFANCTALQTAPNVPRTVNDIKYLFSNCTSLRGNIYIFSTNIDNAYQSFGNVGSTYAKNVYVYANSITYNTFYSYLGNATTNSALNVSLKTFYSHVSFTGVTGEAIIFVNEKQINTSNGLTNIRVDDVGTFNYKCYSLLQGKAEGSVVADVGQSVSTNVQFSGDTGTVVLNLDANYDQSCITGIKLGYDGVEFNLSAGQSGMGVAHIVVPIGMTVTYEVSYVDYRSSTGTVKVTGHHEVMLSGLTVRDYQTVVIEAPFTSNSGYLSNLVDNNNFQISGDYIQSGPKSYNVNKGISSGYIEFTTPGSSEDFLVEVTCYTSSESSSWDPGGVAITYAVYVPASNRDIKSIPSSTGIKVYSGGGTSETEKTYTANMSSLQPNTKYYLTFMYGKDSSSHGGLDRFFIRRVKFNTKK